MSKALTKVEDQSVEEIEMPPRFGTPSMSTNDFSYLDMQHTGDTNSKTKEWVMNNLKNRENVQYNHSDDMQLGETANAMNEQSQIVRLGNPHGHHCEDMPNNVIPDEYSQFLQQRRNIDR